MASRLKDRRVVELETTQAVAERLQKWAKLFAYFVGLPLLLTAFLLGWAGLQKYNDFAKLVDSATEQVKPRLEQAKAGADEAKKQADEAKAEAAAAKKTVEASSTLVKQVSDLSKRFAALESQTSGQLKAASEGVGRRVSDLDKEMGDARKDIAEQQKKLASTDSLVKALFSKGKTEYFYPKNQNSNFVFFPVNADQKPTDNGVIVFMLLSEIPIPQTVEVKWRVYSQPRNSYRVWSRNVVFFSWGESVTNLQQWPLEVTYVPDASSTSSGALETPYKGLALKNGTIYADDTPMMKLGDR